MNGNAVVFASSVSDNSPKTKGILFNGNTGIMYDYVDLEDDVTIPSGKTWTIANDQIFEILPYVTLTNNGTIYNNGEINNYGTINGSGTIIGNSVFNDDIIDEDDYFESYEYEGKMSLKDIFTLNADITGDIVGIIGVDNFDDEDDFFDPNIDVVVRDKETGTIIYEIYQDITSDQYDSKYWEYYPWEAGEGGMFYPSVWNSNDIKASAFAIDKFLKREYNTAIQHFISDSIDIVVEVIVYNAMLDHIKIPGVGELYVEWDDEPNPGLLAISKYDPHKMDCSDDNNKNKCPCEAWNEIRTVPSNNKTDVIIVPHRGIWGGELGFGSPENSENAIKKVGGNPFGVVEIDIMMSYDDALVASHDYSFNRLSDFSEDEPYWFDQRTIPASWNPLQVLWWMLSSKRGPLEAHLKYRNGQIDMNSHYLELHSILKLLKDHARVALIDIKAITNDYDASYQPIPTVKIKYERRTPEGREKVKKDWISIFKKCYKVASKRGMLDYIAFKTEYTYEELTGRGGISEEQAKYVRFMPMVQAADNRWNRNKALSLIDSWTESAPNNVKDMVIAIETNFNLPNKEGKDSVYFEEFTHKNKRYANLFEYVHSKGLRTGFFSEEPVGVRGVADRYGKWHMPSMFEKKKADHLLLLEVPYFKSAVITTDRPDIWRQLMINANFTQLLSAEISDDMTASNVTPVDNMKQIKITAKYNKSGSIILDGLNQKDVGSNLMLYDLQGCLLYKSKINMYPQMVIAKNLPVGIYVLRVSGDRQSSIKLIAN
jgi:glycerophosphoryl diester phosphodiesterase